MDTSWTNKYTPKNIKEIVAQNKASEQLKEFINNYKKQTKKAVLLYGPTGTGKTSSVYAITNELNHEIIEINASDVRNEEQINNILKPALNQMSLFYNEKIILIDEIDGISGTKDRGGINAILKLIDKSRYPIIFTANDPWDKKFSRIRTKSKLIEYRHLSYISISSALKNICKKEKIDFEEETIKTLARRAGGDLRAAITDLQIISSDNKRITKEAIEELSPRKQSEKIINALIKIYKTTDPAIALPAFDDIDENQDKIFLWIDENTPKEYTRPKDLYKAYEILSKADIFRRRITRKQYYRFMVYIYNFLTVGIALSKDEKYKRYVPYQPTTRILKIWKANMKYQKRKSIAMKISKNNHLSIKMAIKNISYYKIMFKNSKKFELEITKELDLEKSEVDWLKK